MRRKKLGRHICTPRTLTSLACLLCLSCLASVIRGDTCICTDRITLNVTAPNSHCVVLQCTPKTFALRKVASRLSPKFFCTRSFPVWFMCLSTLCTLSGSNIVLKLSRRFWASLGEPYGRDVAGFSKFWGGLGEPSWKDFEGFSGSQDSFGPRSRLGAELTWT